MAEMVAGRAPERLLPFFSTVVVIAAVVRSGSAFLRSPAAKPVILCGQQSLEIFCLGILLSALGHFVLSEYDSGIVIQLAVNAVGVLLLFLTAKMIDWYRAVGRSPQPGSRALTIRRRGDI